MDEVKPKQVKLHLPEDLHQFLKISAAKNRRSLNAEVAFRLDNSRQGEAQQLKGGHQ